MVQGRQGQGQGLKLEMCLACLRYSEGASIARLEAQRREREKKGGVKGTQNTESLVRSTAYERGPGRILL